MFHSSFACSVSLSLSGFRQLEVVVLKSKWIMIIKSPICLMVFVTHFVSKNGSKHIMCVPYINHFYCSLSLSLYLRAHTKCR